MITHTALQFQAMRKICHGDQDRKILKHRRIWELATKETLLTLREVELLEHYVHSSNYILENTVYWENEIIHPCTREPRTRRLTVKRTPSSR